VARRGSRRVRWWLTSRRSQLLQSSLDLWAQWMVKRNATHNVGIYPNPFLGLPIGDQCVCQQELRPCVPRRQLASALRVPQGGRRIPPHQQFGQPGAG
jgi:hypothetical protein